MRILYVLHQFYPEFHGGTERVTYNIARAAQRAGHYAHILTCTVNPGRAGGMPSSDIRGALHGSYGSLPVTRLPRQFLPPTADISFDIDPALADSLTLWIRRQRFSIVHVMHTMRMATALAAVQRSGLPFVVTLTDLFLPCFLVNMINLDGEICTASNQGRQCGQDCLVAPWNPAGLTQRYSQAAGLLSSASTRICPSEFLANRFRMEYPDLDFRVIPHGVDLLPLAKHQRLIPEPPQQAITLGFLGTIIPQKGIDTLVKAFSQVRDGRLKLRIAGGTYGNTAFFEQVRTASAQDGRIEWLGHLAPEQAMEFINSLDVLCIPSRVPESFSMVLHEAAALGKPALVTDLGAPKEFVVKHMAGRVLPHDDINAWKSAIADLCADASLIESWRKRLWCPNRVEEEAFFYESLYRNHALQITAI
ncbi:MAG: hypothetical protein BroJett006_12250 [Betaproteobacteria bacterium]|nr:MAG: hypothetical protein BroJett006_12250 [Betaproteobacteria bacterium]